MFLPFLYFPLGLGSDTLRWTPHINRSLRGLPIGLLIFLLRSWSAVACHRFRRAEQAARPSRPVSQATGGGATKAVASHRTPKSPCVASRPDGSSSESEGGEELDATATTDADSWSAVACHRFRRAEHVSRPNRPFPRATVVGATKAVASHRTPKAPCVASRPDGSSSESEGGEELDATATTDARTPTRLPQGQTGHYAIRRLANRVVVGEDPGLPCEKVWKSATTRLKLF